MANMSFGVNILPKSNNTYTLGNSDYKWNIFVNTINGTALSNIILPTVTSTDNGKILGVSNGAWTAITAPTTDISGLAPKASPIFTGSISLGRKDNTTVGGNSYAVGTNVEASADNAHAEGNSTRAAYVDSHSEGWGSEAISQAAHAEGRQGRATAFSAHAEGCQTVASGYASHSQGMGTQAKNKSQHVAGEYNVLDPSVNAAGVRGEYAEIIGNGTDNSNRSNARVLDWNGNERLKGDLYVNCNADSTGGVKVATKEYVDNAFSSEENTIDIDKTISTPAAIQTIEDSADGLPIGMEIEIEPVQNLHGYDNPWSAGGGKNLIPVPYVFSSGETVSGVTATYDAFGVITGNGTGNGYYNAMMAETSFSAGTYTFHAIQSNDNTRIVLYKNGTAFKSHAKSDSPLTFTLSEDAQLSIKIVFLSGYSFSNATIKPYLAQESSFTEWSPYANICPISGWTGANVNVAGKNLINATLAEIKAANTSGTWVNNAYTINGITFTVNADFTITANGTATNRADMNILHSLGKGNYFINGVTNGASNRFYATYIRVQNYLVINGTIANGDYLLEINSETTTYIYGLRVASGVTVNNVVFKPMVRFQNDSDPAYKPFSGYVTYNTSFPSEAGTVYGGTLTVNQDGTGSLVVDKGYVDLGMLNYTKYDVAQGTMFRGQISDTAKVTLSETVPNFICSRYPVVATGSRVDKTVSQPVGNPWVDILDNDYSDATEFKSAMSGVQLVYELAEPITYQLSNLEVIETLLGLNNIWADTGDINSLTYSKQTSGLINTQDKVKINSLSTVALSGSYTDLLNKPDLSQYLTSVPTMTGATSSANGTAGLIPAPTSADAGKFFRGDGTWQDGGRPMVILSYGNSDWDDFIAAYNNNVIVYCRASSSSNPASGSQTRMAFMAYVNNATTPTEVEFQYYRSVNSHSATQMGDQVYVYKLTNKDVWSVTVREASIKEIKINTNSAGSVSWSSNIVTLNSGLPKVSASDNGKILMVVDGEWTAVTPST